MAHTYQDDIHTDEILIWIRYTQRGYTWRELIRRALTRKRHIKRGYTRKRHRHKKDVYLGEIFVIGLVLRICGRWYFRDERNFD